MTTLEKIQQVNNLLNQTENEVTSMRVKRLNNDRGLIERTESSKIVLTEDNKELLID